MYKKIIVLLIAIVSSAALACTAMASPSSLSAAKKEASSVSSAEKKFKRQYKKLSSAEKTKLRSFLKTASAGTFEDSDDDGVPDLVEGSDRTLDQCDSDNDDDGKDDGDELRDGEDPSDSDSDDDGHLDGEEKEVKGSITAVGDSSITVGSRSVVYLITESTELEELSLDDLVVGACVKVEGFNNGDGTYTAKKIEAKSRCS